MLKRLFSYSWFWGTLRGEEPSVHPAPSLSCKHPSICSVNETPRWQLFPNRPNNLLCVRVMKPLPQVTFKSSWTSALCLDSVPLPGKCLPSEPRHTGRAFIYKSWSLQRNRSCQGWAAILLLFSHIWVKHICFSGRKKKIPPMFFLFVCFLFLVLFCFDSFNSEARVKNVDLLCLKHISHKKLTFTCRPTCPKPAEQLQGGDAAPIVWCWI